jgi:glycosyltransferase involved in cell wall biosynthesis
MHIGFSAFIPPDSRPGVAAYQRELLRHLQQEDPVSDYDILLPRQQADSVPLTAINFTKTLYTNLAARPAANFVWHNTALPLLGRARRYNLLHVPDWRRIPLVKKCPILATVHDAGSLARPDNGPARKLLLKQLRGADHLIAVSRCLKKLLVEHASLPPEKITVLTSGIDRRLFRPVRRAEACARLTATRQIKPPFIVYAARLEHPCKNHLRLIEAFERFRLRTGGESRLVLPGAEAAGAEIIRRRAAESPVAADILFPGFVSPEELALFYSACDLMIYPSLTEGFGLPVIEALASGARAVCSNTSALREISGHIVPKFNPHSPDEMVRCLEKHLSEEWSREHRRRALEYAAEFDWSRTARQTLELYERTARP